MPVEINRSEIPRTYRDYIEKPEGVTERLKSMLYKVYGSNAFKVK